MALMQIGPKTYDIATPADIRQVMIEQGREREKLRGIKDIRRSVQLPGTAATRVTIADGIAVPAGYKWVIRLLGVSTVSAGIGVASITSDPNATLAGASLAMIVASFPNSLIAQVATFGNGACVLSEGEGLFLYFAQNISGYLITGWEVPAERIGEFA